MERAIRIGKDFNVRWSIRKRVDGERQPYELAGKELVLQYRTPYGLKEATEWEVVGNTIVWTFRGKEQKALGSYELVLTENGGKDGMVTVDTCRAFKLVAHSCEETDGSGGDIVIEDVVLESEVAFAALRGPQGEQGPAGPSYDDTEIKGKLAELSASLGKYEGLKTSGSVIFTAAEVPHGNIIYVSFSNINTAGNILVKNAEGTILHRFVNEGGKGSSFVGESYVLPSDYDKIEVGSYGSVNLSIEVSSYSFDFINGKIKDLEGYNIEQDSKINGLEQNLEMENIADFVALEPISIEEGKFVYSSGAESSSSLQNIANYDVADLAGIDLVIKAWVSTNSVVGYYFVLDNGGQQGGSFYDKGGIVTEHVLRVPAKAKTLRFSYYKEGGISAKYRPSISLKEYVVMTANKVGIASSLAGSNALVASTDVLANEIFTMEGAPTYTKKDCVMSFKANIASFNSISFGMGYDTIRGLQVIVDANTITFKAAGAARFTESHGLTIGTYLRCSVYHELKTFKFVISTLSGTYYKEYEMSWLPDSETYGIPYIYADNGTELRNVKLSRGGADFKKPVWIFGESYLSFQSFRWIYYILEYGFHNFMLCGLAGANSAQMYEQLECCLKLGMPKYIVWCLGMNDGVNATPYKTYYEKVREICEKNGIELILQTIPNVPNADKSAINAIIKNSGLRYIDAADAVGSYETANWYDGFLEDGVHPSELGAQAIAAQVLADFPEIMQY